MKRVQRERPPLSRKEIERILTAPPEMSSSEIARLIKRTYVSVWNCRTLNTLAAINVWKELHPGEKPPANTQFRVRQRNQSAWGRVAAMADQIAALEKRIRRIEAR